MKYYSFKKRITKYNKENQYELISFYETYEEAEKERYRIATPFIKENKISYLTIDEWLNEEYPIRKEGTFRIRYLF